MYDQGLESLMSTKYQGRPHPGKNNYATAASLEKVYPMYGKFSALIKELDPSGMFQNEYLERWFPQAYAKSV